MASEKRYRVTFYKRIRDEHGAEREIRQHVVEVTARDEEGAGAAAQEAFCRLASLADWRLHADRFEVEACEP